MGAFFRLIAVLGLIFSPIPAFAQAQSIQQSGPVTAGHVGSWVYNGILQDAGTSQNPNVTTLGIYGTGTPFCISNTKVRTGAYYQLCMGYSADLSAANISLTPFGGAPDIPLNITAGGTIFPIGPGGLSSLMDQQFGSQPGDIICRGVSSWSALGAGPVGQVLTSNGSTSCPSWATAGSPIAPALRVISSGTTDTALTSDGTIAWKSAAASGKTETLYVCDSNNNGKVLYIKDAQGTAGTYPITIAPNGSDTIDGISLYIMSFNHQSVTLQCLGASALWMVL